MYKNVLIVGTEINVRDSIRDFYDENPEDRIIIEDFEDIKEIRQELDGKINSDTVIN